MKRVLFILSFMAIVSSCNSDENPPQQTNFYALTVGNSWMYKYYIYSSQTQTYEDTGVVNNVSIVGTEDVYGNTFYKFKTIVTGNNNNNYALFPSNGESFYFMREDDGNLINKSGFLIFTNNNYDEILIKNKEAYNYSIYAQLQTETETITTEAGTFDCVYSKRYVKFNDTGVLGPSEDKYHYKEGIGLIKSTLSYIASPIPVVEKRLFSYNVQ